jgi:hypothetical protein
LLAIWYPGSATGQCIQDRVRCATIAYHHFPAITVLDKLVQRMQFSFNTAFDLLLAILKFLNT